MRVELHERPVFEGARFHLVCVCDKIFRPRSIRSHRHEAPFHPCRKPSSSTPSQIQTLDKLGDLLRLQLKSFTESLISPRCFICIDIEGLLIRTKVAGEWSLG